MFYAPSFRDDLYTDIKPSYLSHTLTEEEIDSRKFGLPRFKKYPMPDAAHVRSAIKFFNYVTPTNEAELARNILARMDEYGIDPETINVGDNNRFKKYLERSTLKHHGIKGQKWGVRRFQNPDGSYTAAGKARRGSKDSVSKKLTSSKAAKIAAGAAITAAGIAAVAYMNDSIISPERVDKAVDDYRKATMKAAGDLYSETEDNFEANKKAFDGDWPSIDAKICRTNARYIRKSANDMFQAYSKSRTPFVDKADKAWHNSAGTSRRSKARVIMKRTDEAISEIRDLMLDYADRYDAMADELNRRRGN